MATRVNTGPWGKLVDVELLSRDAEAAMWGAVCAVQAV